MLKLFNHISQVGSPSEKIQLLKSYPYQEELKSVLKYATDPFLTFGITHTEGSPMGSEDAFKVLDKLARRELTGERARVSLGNAATDEDDREILHRILRKDLRCGLGEKLVLQAYPGLIRQFEVMRAAKFEKLSSRTEYYIEPKYDGLRCIAVVENGGVTLLSRNGKEFTSSDHLKPQILRLFDGEDGVLDGELTSGNFNDSVSAVKRKDQQNGSTILNAFDFLDMHEWRSPINTYHTRRGNLKRAFERAGGNLPHLILVPCYPVQDEDEAFRWYDHFLKQGYEGGILKASKGLYRFKRHRDWMKLKEVNDVDLRVESLIQGEGKYHGMLGAVIVKFNGKRVNVGSGFSDTERQLYWDQPELIQRKVIEIQYHQVTPDGSLRHPRFIKVREDKS